MHRTANGKFLDMNALKIQQERTIAVGNSRQNARGDILGPGGQIVVSRDELVNEYYKNQQGASLNSDPIYTNADEAASAVIADNFFEPMPNGLEEVNISQENLIEVNPTSEPSGIGGLNDAKAKSAELAELLRAQRRRI
jgi:hypothetical protein